MSAPLTLEEQLSQAREAERERCAKLAETWGNAPPNPNGRRAKLAAAIRALPPKAQEPARSVVCNRLAHGAWEHQQDADCLDPLPRPPTGETFPQYVARMAAPAEPVKAARQEGGKTATEAMIGRAFREWSVRSGDRCDRCDMPVDTACLPCQFKGCERHQEEHEATDEHHREMREWPAPFIPEKQQSDASHIGRVYDSERK